MSSCRVAPTAGRRDRPGSYTSLAGRPVARCTGRWRRRDCPERAAERGQRWAHRREREHAGKRERDRPALHMHPLPEGSHSQSQRPSARSKIEWSMVAQRWLAHTRLRVGKRNMSQRSLHTCPQSVFGRPARDPREPAPDGRRVRRFSVEGATSIHLWRSRQRTGEFLRSDGRGGSRCPRDVSCSPWPTHLCL
jgi:hypothetical protein